jgi:predicted DNA binding CopG/RHH family protein
MEFLKAILGDKYPEFEAAITAYNALPENKDKQVKLADLGGGEYVGVGKYNTVVAERDGFKEKLDTAEGTITTLKKDNKDNKTLQQTIKDHETTIQTLKTTYEGKIKELTINTAIQSKLTDAKYPELIVGKFDKSKLSLSEDGTQVYGIDEQLTVIKEQYKDLFIPVVTGKEPYNKEKNPTGVKNPWSKEHFNLTEQGKLLKDNPELAKQLMASV